MRIRAVIETDRHFIVFERIVAVFSRVLVEQLRHHDPIRAISGLQTQNCPQGRGVRRMLDVLECLLRESDQVSKMVCNVRVQSCTPL